MVFIPYLIIIYIIYKSTQHFYNKYMFPTSI